MKWVHRKCLNKWRVSATNPRNFDTCRHCGFAFRLVLKRDPTQDDEQLRRRRRRFLFRTTSRFFLWCSLVQLALGASAMALRAIDQKEALVKVFDFPQIDGSPPAGEGDFWNAIKVHKCTYYTAAVLLVLALIGLTIVLRILYFVLSHILCCTLCCGNSCKDHCLACPRDPVVQYICLEECCEALSCTEDCCLLCQGDCCDYGVCCSECTRNIQCNNSNTCDECKRDKDMLYAIAIALIVLLVIAGLIAVLMALVVWIQKTATQFYQLKELRYLTGDYEVEDLSQPQYADLLSMPMPSAPTQQDIESAPSAPPAPPGLCTDPDVKQSLKMDLQAVYGYSTY